MPVTNAYPADIDLAEIERRVRQDERGLGPLASVAPAEIGGRPATAVTFDTAVEIDAPISRFVAEGGAVPDGAIRFVRGTVRVGADLADIMVQVPRDPDLLALRAVAMLMADGWAFEHAVGIAANIHGESGFDPAAIGDGGTALGLCQWRLDRQTHFEEMQGRPLDGSTFAEQIAYISWEMDNHETRARDELRATGDVRAAAEAVCRFYERPADPDRDSSRRADFAEQLAARFPS
jgi:hypothetical protein